MRKIIISILYSTLVFTSNISMANTLTQTTPQTQYNLQQMSKSRNEILEVCSTLSRNLINEKYFKTDEVNLLEMTTWLSSEDPANSNYRFIIYTHLRKSDLALYSWTFSVVTHFSENDCHVLSEKFEHETKLIEDDEDDDQVDDSDLQLFKKRANKN